MKKWKRIALALGIVAALVLVALALAPLLFKDEIEARVKTAINQRVDAHVEFGDVGIGLIRSFPNLAFSLEDLSVTGVDAFDGDTLAHVGRFRLVVDLGSAIAMWRRGDPLVVRQIIVDRPYLHARVLPDGRASWDILKTVGELDRPEEPEAGRAPAAIDVALRRLAIHDGRLAYDDAATGLRARVVGLEHTLTGDFAARRFGLRTRTSADSVTVVHAGVPYLSDARLEAVADLDADLRDPDARRLTFRENRVALNELGLGLDGTAVLTGDAVDLDITFAADRARFGDILSLVPAVYSQDFATLETSGTVAVTGMARGRLAPRAAADSATAAIPAFSLNVDVDDGRFQYPDLPLPVRGVFVDLSVSNPGGALDSTRVELSRFQLTAGDDPAAEPFRATLVLTTPVSDPELRATMDGRLDLGALGRAVKLEGVDELRGTVTSDAAVHARASWLEAADYERVEATGRVELRGVAVSGEALRHAVAVDELRLELAPSYADMPGFAARVGSSDFSGSGRLENLLGFALRDEELRGRATLASRYIALDEWRSDDRAGLEVIPVPANVDLSLTATVDSMTFGDVVMNDAHGALRVRDRRVTLDEFALSTLGGAIVTSGWYETVDLERPAFDFQLAMADLDIHGAFRTFNTVRALAPAAEYATGEFSADLAVAGLLGPDMVPVFDSLDGRGGIRTDGVAVRGMPALHRLADAVRIAGLRDPALTDFAAAIRIDNGRLIVDPFDVGLGPAAVTVSGSNGLDRSLDYRLELRLPRTALGDEADQAIAGLMSRAGRAGIQLDQADAVRLDARVGGTMRDPTVRVDFGEALSGTAANVRGQVEARLREEAGAAIDSARILAEEARQRAEAEARARADSLEARSRAAARARADSILVEADSAAARIRREAARTAARIRAEADEQGRKFVAEASNPLARRAAEAAADRLRKEADERATGIEAEADRRAQQLLQQARARADSIVGGSPEAG